MQADICNLRNWSGSTLLNLSVGKNWARNLNDSSPGQPLASSVLFKLNSQLMQDWLFLIFHMLTPEYQYSFHIILKSFSYL